MKYKHYLHHLQKYVFGLKEHEQTMKQVMETEMKNTDWLECVDNITVTKC